jgi:hypothetical protein
LVLVVLVALSLIIQALLVLIHLSLVRQYLKIQQVLVQIP